MHTQITAQRLRKSPKTTPIWFTKRFLKFPKWLQKSFANQCQQAPSNPSDGTLMAHKIWVVSAVRRGFYPTTSEVMVTKAQLVNIHIYHFRRDFRSQNPTNAHFQHHPNQMFCRIAVRGIRNQKQVCAGNIHSTSVGPVCRGVQFMSGLLNIVCVNESVSVVYRSDRKSHQ